jgi:hypothetical protein
MNAASLCLSLPFETPAWAAARGNRPYVALRGLIPPLLLRSRPDLWLSAIPALKRPIDVELSLDEIRNAVAARRSQQARIDQDLALESLGPIRCRPFCLNSPLFGLMFGALFSAPSFYSGPARTVASHGIDAPVRRVAADRVVRI